MSSPESLSRKVVRYGLVLMLVCGISSAGVAQLYQATKARIAGQHKAVFQQTLRAVFPDTVTDIRPLEGAANTAAPGETPREEDLIQAGYDAQGRVVAYAALGRQQGYQSEISVIVAVRPDPADPRKIPADPQIIAMRVVASQETPGLGQNISAEAKSDTLWAALTGNVKPRTALDEVPPFQRQFRDKRLDQLQVVKMPKEGAILALTGATISSQATTDAVKKAVARIQDALKTAAPPAK